MGLFTTKIAEAKKAGTAVFVSKEQAAAGVPHVFVGDGNSGVGDSFKKVGKAISNATKDIAKFDEKIYGAAFNGLRIKDNKLALTANARSLVPPKLRPVADQITAAAGYGVIAMTAGTALGVGAVSGATGSGLQGLSSFLSTGGTVGELVGGPNKPRKTGGGAPLVIQGVPPSDDQNTTLLILGAIAVLLVLSSWSK